MHARFAVVAAEDAMRMRSEGEQRTDYRGCEFTVQADVIRLFADGRTEKHAF
jgi:hypothetical protein